jgi:4-oxalocrotonate tautomerase
LAAPRPHKALATITALNLNWKGSTMPFVNIRVTKDGVTAEQKAALIKGVTQLLVDVLDKNPQTTVVIIDEVETDNWGMGGESVTVRRAKAS